MQNLVSHPEKRDTGSLSLSSGFIMTDIKRDKTLETSVLM